MKSTDPTEIHRRKKLARILREMRVAARTDMELNYALKWKYGYQRSMRKTFAEMVQKWI